VTCAREKFSANAGLRIRSHYEIREKRDMRTEIHWALSPQPFLSTMSGAFCQLSPVLAILAMHGTAALITGQGQPGNCILK
jgi:hypothetical protein